MSDVTSVSEESTSTTTTSANSPRLPLELIFQIIDCLRPTYAVALPLQDPTAQCIKAFTLVCRATYEPALRLLYSHCLFIDSSERLRRLLLSLGVHAVRYSSSSSLLQSRPTLAREYDDNGDEIVISQDAPSAFVSGGDTCCLPAVDVLSCLQNLYLAPFTPQSIDDLPTAEWIFELFCLSRHTLRRLVSGIPLHTLSHWHDHLNVRARLRAAFTELKAVEEFVCLYDDLRFVELGARPHLDQFDHSGDDNSEEVSSGKWPIWLGWTQLRRLSLRKCNMYYTGYGHLSRLKKLETVVVVASHCYEQDGWNKVFENYTRGRGGSHDGGGGGGDNNDDNENSENASNEIQILWPAYAQTHHRTRRIQHSRYLERLHYAQVWNDRRNSCSLSSSSSSNSNSIISSSFSSSSSVSDNSNTKPGSGVSSSSNNSNPSSSSHSPSSPSFSSASGKRERTRVKMTCIAIDERYAPDETQRGYLFLQTWLTDRAVDGTLFRVGAAPRFKRQTDIHEDYWVDDGFDGGAWVRN